MSQYLNMDGKVILEIPFPTERIVMILNTLNFPGADQIEDLSFEQKQILILVSFREFLKGHLMLEEFSEIASHIKTLFPQETRTSEQEDYESMIYEAADMSLYARMHYQPAENMFAGFMDGVWNYFNKYKHLLDSLPNEYSNSSPLEKE